MNFHGSINHLSVSFLCCLGICLYHGITDRFCPFILFAQFWTNTESAFAPAMENVLPHGCCQGTILHCLPSVSKKSHPDPAQICFFI